MKTPIWCAILIQLVAIVPAWAANPPALEKEVTAAINSFRQAMLTGDKALMGKLLHPDLTYCHSSGSTEDRATVMSKTMKSEYFEYTETSIRIHGTTALVKNVTDMRNAAAKDTPNRLNVLYVWVKGSDGWQLMARHPIRLPIPGAEPVKGATAKKKKS